MAVSLPTSADVRKAREQAAKTINEQAGVARTPLLAVLGATDVAITAAINAIANARSRATKGREAVSELPNRLNRDELRKSLDAMSESAKKAYIELAKRGEQTWAKLREQPQFVRVVQGAQDASGRFDQVVDDVHDAAEEALNRISRTTRSTGEKTARRAQRFAGQAAETVQEAADEAAERIQHAGDEAAHTARSTSRKAAARTQPVKDEK